MLHFSIQNASPTWDEEGRVRDDGLSSDYRRIILGWSSNRLYIGGSNSGIFR